MHMPDKEVIFVIGAGRSGTSAITRVLSLCGCGLPPLMLGAHSNNPKGFWEPLEGVTLNLSFEIRHGTSPIDPTMRFQDLVLDEQVKEDFVGQVRSFLSRCPHEKVLVVKTPGITSLMEFWLEAARREGFAAKVAILIRHPTEWHASINKGGQDSGRKMSMESTNAIWLKLNLLAERYSRSLPRVFIEYSNLVEDWRAQIARLGSALDVDLEVNEVAVDNFLTPSLYRQRRTGQIEETFGNCWTKRLYEALSLAARDEPLDLLALDEIYRAHRACERTFRLASEEFQEMFKRIQAQPERLLRDVPVWVSGRDF